jgi:hypothetical protein
MVLTRRLALALPLAAALALAAPGCISRKVSAVTAPGSLRIISLAATPDRVYLGEESVITAEVDNPGGGELTYSWQAYSGSVVGRGARAYYYGAYCCMGTDWVVLQVRNERDERDTKLVVLTVYPDEP